jgi:hypothetical protein
MPHPLPGSLCGSRLGADWTSDGTLGLQRTRAPGVLGQQPALNGPFDQVFQALDQRTGQPIANTPYRITLESGRVFLGVTDDQGRTQKVGADRAQTATLEIPYDGNSPSTPDTGKQYHTCSR